MSILTDPFDQAYHFYMMVVMLNYNYKSFSLINGVQYLKLFFLFSICCIAETVFSTHILYSVLAKCKSQFVDYSRAEQTTFSRGTIIISFETFIWSLLGNTALRLFRCHRKLTLAHIFILFVTILF